MTIEDGQKKFAAKRKQRRCHDSFPLVLIRIVYYIIQLVFMVFGLTMVVGAVLFYRQLKAGGSQANVDLQQVMPILQGTVPLEVALLL